MSEPFGGMLRRFRLAASLTQEQLAERAMISATAVAALERGRRRAPRLSTVRQLGRALELTDADLAALALAATGDGGGAPATAVSEAAIPEAAAFEALRLRNRRLGSPAPEPTPPEAPPSQSPTAGSTELPGPVGRRWRTGFVGRSGELGQLRACWAVPKRFTLVLGEAGIGKTRLVTELARSLAGEGVPVLWGRCPEERLGAYFPFVEVTRQIAATMAPAQLREAIGGRGELTRLVPELDRLAGSLAPPVTADAGTERRLLFESLADLMAAWCPALLVVDDLHWAHQATVDLLRYLATRDGLESLRIVATARPAELGAEATGLIADLGRRTETGQIELEHLGPEDLGNLIGELVGSPAGPDLIDAVGTTTEGNPFFAEELVLHLVDSGSIETSSGDAGLRASADVLGVPGRIRDMLARKLLSLSPEALRLLIAGSIIGRQFEVTLAAAAADLTGPAMVDAADDALLSGLVVEPAPGHLAFSHVLVQEAVANHVSFVRRAATHRRIAEVLEERRSDDPSAVIEIARHWAVVAKVDPTTTSTAAAWAVRAGDVALAAASPDEAIACYEEASSLWASSTRGHADALIRLGTALQYTGRADEADQRFRASLQLAIGLGDAELRARAAIGLGRRYPYWETDQERVDALEGALAALGARGGPAGNFEEDKGGATRLTVMAMLVTHLIAGFDDVQAARRDDLAAEVRAAVDDPEAPPDLLLGLGRTRLYDAFEDPIALQRVALRLVDTAERHSDLRVLAAGRFAQVLSSLDRADLAELRAASAAYDRMAAELDDPRERSQSATVRAAIAVIEGRYEDGAALSEEAVHEGRSAGDLNAELVYFAQGVLRAVDQGAAHEVLPLLLAATEYRHIVSFAAGTALCAAMAGDEDTAGASLDAFTSRGLDGLPRGADRWAPLAFLAHTAVLLREETCASLLYEALRDQPVTGIRVGPSIGWWGTVGHHLGALCRVLGRLEEAEERLRRALELETRIGARPFAARSAAELARVLLERGSPGADALVEDAAHIARVTGAGGIGTEVEEVRRLLA